MAPQITSLDKTDQLLIYLAKNHGKTSITGLIKLAYLVDLLSIRRIGKKLSEFNYIRWHFGPFDKAIYERISKLEKSYILMPKTEYTALGEYVAYVVNNEYSDDLPELEGFSELVDEVLESVKGYGPKALKDIAYATAPMKAFGATQGGVEHMGEDLQLELVRQ